MSSEWPDYELIDFGEGRKLERFDQWVLDRPAPAAAGVAKSRPAAWQDATARYAAHRAADGQWSLPALRWGTAGAMRVPLGGGAAFRLLLEPLPSGQVGLFPEQWDNWQWLASRVAAQGPPLNVLNLFAYTGGATLAATVTGADVTHVDAAKGMVTRARMNADFSDSTRDWPIRWIVEDAMKFCRREAKRGNRYDAVILDPPTYGHGPKGEEWLINRDLLPLLRLCGELTERRPKFVLLTSHSPGLGPAELSAYLSEGIFGGCGQPPRTGELFLETADGRRLASGTFARWPG